MDCLKNAKIATSGTILTSFVNVISTFLQNCPQADFINVLLVALKQQAMLSAENVSKSIPKKKCLICLAMTILNL